MAMQEEVSLVASKPEGEIENPPKTIALAVQEVKHCLQVTNDSLSQICNEMESAT